MITNIRTLKNHLENSKVGGNDAIAIMVVIRKLIEKDKKKYNFKWLHHFCNWCMHPKINDPKVSVDIINSFISSFLQIGKIDIIWDKGRLHLSYEDNRKSIENYFDFIIDNFRKELTGLLNDYHIDNEFIKTDEDFILFFARVLYIVKDSPLRPKNIKNEDYDKLKEKFYKQWIWSKGVCVSPELYPIGITIFHKLDGSFSLSVEMKNGQSFTFKPITYHGGIFLMQPEAVNEHFHRGNALVDKGELEKAATAFQQSINIWPTSAACCNLSSVLSKLGKHNEALSTAEKALELNPDDHIAWTNKSQALNNLKNHEEGLIAAEKAISLKSDFPQAWCNKSAALGGLGRYVKSLSAAEKAIELRPDYAIAWSNKSCALDKLDRSEEALQAVDKAIKLDPENADFWHAKGEILDKLGSSEEAKKAFRKAKELKRKHK